MMRRRAPEPKSHSNGGYLVKVAYLLVTTAWLVGAQTGAAQEAVKQPVQPAQPAAVAPVTVYGGSGSCGCNTCCDSGCGGGFLQRCRDFCGRLFSHGCNTCGSSC